MPFAQRLAGKGGGRQIGGADLYPQFLPEFAHQRKFGAFAAFRLAAGEFPKPRQRFARRAALHQHPALAIDQRRGNHQQGVGYLLFRLGKDFLNSARLS